MAEDLRTPLRDVLDAELDEADVPRLWRGVEQRRARRRVWRKGSSLAAVAAAIGLALAAGWWLRGGASEEPAFARIDGSPILGPLRPGTRTEYADASWVETSAEASASVLSSGPRDFVIHLRAGSIEVQVTPGGPRRWVVEAGDAAVEVVGTQFRVERDGERVLVSVSRGAVVVRHPELDDGLTRVAAGESVVVGAPPPPPIPLAPRLAPRAAITPPSAPSVPAPAASPRAPSIPSPARRTESWTALARSGDYERAYAALGPGGTRRASTGASPAELMDLADVARQSGHPAEAVAPLERLLSQYPSDPSAPLAAFVLGQIELDQLHRPREAARHFDRAIEAGLPAALAGDAQARLALARAQSGDAEGAREAACAYLAEHPDGLRAAAMRRRCPEEAQ
ncbi:MAG: FecR domain-containing protein [Myxococcales bacterium]|nr:FecR domain-containing protein [Myxococcales bacterium]